MIALENFFAHLNDFAHPELFENLVHPWDPLKNLQDKIKSLINERYGDVSRADTLQGTTFANEEDRANGKIGHSLFVNQWIEIKTPVLLKPLGIVIGRGTVLEPSAIIKGPVIIGPDCEIRQGAYIRGNAIVGSHCVIGHATEIKNSIVMNHSECGHFNYIGDSIVGSHVNMGAGSKMANFQFRTPEEKEQNIIRPILVPVGGEPVETHMQKLGAIVGDNVELGCNAVLSPGTLMGRNNWLYPNTTFPKGYYPPNSIVSPRDRKPKISRQ